jgi:hypothetical protein
LNETGGGQESLLESKLVAMDSGDDKKLNGQETPANWNAWPGVEPSKSDGGLMLIRPMGSRLPDGLTTGKMICETGLL